MSLLTVTKQSYTKSLKIILSYENRETFLPLVFFSCAQTNKEIVDYILPKEYNFKIISCKESNMLYFEGVDVTGNIVLYDIPDFWGIKYNYEIGDSIIKKKGEKNIKLIKADTIILRLGGQDDPLYPEEQDSIFKELTKERY